MFKAIKNPPEEWWYFSGVLEVVEVPDWGLGPWSHSWCVPLMILSLSFKFHKNPTCLSWVMMGYVHFNMMSSVEGGWEGGWGVEGRTGFKDQPRLINFLQVTWAKLDYDVFFYYYYAKVNIMISLRQINWCPFVETCHNNYVWLRNGLLTQTLWLQNITD